MPRVRSLAQSLGVTIATLDQALRELEVQGLIIRKDRSGIFVAPKAQQGRIGLIFGRDIMDATATSFRSLLMEQCRQRSIERGERFSFFVDLGVPNTDGGTLPDDLREALIAKRLAGMITVSPHIDQIKWLQKHDIPVVSLGRDEAWAHRVILHGEELIRLTAQELKKQGCCQIGLLAANANHAEMFRRVMHSMGLIVNESWIEIAKGNHKEEAGLRCAEQFLTSNGVARRWTKKNSLPQAVIITDDMMARGACSLFGQRGVTPGRHLKIASHGNRGSWALAEWEDALTICEYDPQEIVDALFSSLEKLIAGNAGPDEAVYILPHLKISSVRP